MPGATVVLCFLFLLPPDPAGVRDLTFLSRSDVPGVELAYGCVLLERDKRPGILHLTRYLRGEPTARGILVYRDLWTRDELSHGQTRVWRWDHKRRAWCYADAEGWVYFVR